MPTLLQGSSRNANRLVAVSTPLVLAPLAGAITAGVAKYGIDVDDGQLQAIFIAGATIALAKSAQWTKGWQAFEQREAADVAGPVALVELDDLDFELDDEPEAAAFEEELAGVEDVEDDMDDDFDDDTDDFDAGAVELLAAKGS